MPEQLNESDAPQTENRGEMGRAERAYYIGLERQARGEPADPVRDWLEAEGQGQSSAADNGPSARHAASPLLWVAAAACLGFAASLVFGGGRKNG